MRKFFTLLNLFFIILITNAQNSGKKSLIKKCDEIQSFVEQKFNKKFIFHECDISIRHANSIISKVSYESHPDLFFKIETRFDEGYKNIIQLNENISTDFEAYLRKEKAVNLLSPLLQNFESFDIVYDMSSISLFLKGNMNMSNYKSLKDALNLLGQKENKDLLKGTTLENDSAVQLPEFYLNVECTNIDESVFPLMDTEIEGIQQSWALIMEKKGGDIDTLSQYSILTETTTLEKGHTIDLLQRKLTVSSKVDPTYKLSVGGFNYLNKKN